MNFLEDGIDGYKDTVHALQGRGTRSFVPKKLDLDLKDRSTPPAKEALYYGAQGAAITPKVCIFRHK